MLILLAMACGTPDVSVAAEPPEAARSHCASSDKTWYECTVKGDKVVSLCGDEKPTWLQYNFGPIGKPELIYPKEKAGIDPFGFAHETWIRSEADAIRFVNEGHVFLLVDKSCSGARGEGEMNNFQGVVVSKDAKELARLRCEGSLKGAPSALGGMLEAVGYSE